MTDIWLMLIFWLCLSISIGVWKIYEALPKK